VRAVCAVGPPCWHALAATLSRPGPVLTRCVAGTITHMPLEVLANGIISRVRACAAGRPRHLPADAASQTDSGLRVRQASGERASLPPPGAPARLPGQPAVHPPCSPRARALVAGRADACACADTYAFGVLCWEMWTGKRAWSGMHCTQIVIAVTIRQRRLRLPSDAPAAFAELVHQCMADRPEERPNFEVRRPRRPPLDSAVHAASGGALLRVLAAAPPGLSARVRATGGSAPPAGGQGGAAA